MKKLFVCSTSLLLFACAGPRSTPAPIENASTSNPQMVTSQPGSAKPVTVVENAPVDTQITKLNDNDTDNTSTSPVASEKPGVQETPVEKPVVAAASTAAAVAVSEVVLDGVSWTRPVSGGTVIKPYSAALKGIDVSGVDGEPILASADGVVAYSGKGPDGYGLLVILKHKDGFLTAYSHNKVNLVKKDDVVRKGQKIAELGNTDAARPMLHYELRKQGKPINPTKIFQ